MNDYLKHFGIHGMKWGKRRWQYEDGSLTPEGRIHYGKKDAKWAKKNYDKIHKQAYKRSRQELNDYVENDLNKRMSMKNESGSISRAYFNDFNTKMAEIMTKNASDIKTPYTQQAIKFIAKRGGVGVHMIISDENFDPTKSELKRGVYESGKIAYKKKNVNMA